MDLTLGTKSDLNPQDRAPASFPNQEQSSVVDTALNAIQNTGAYQRVTRTARTLATVVTEKASGRHKGQVTAVTNKLQRDQKNLEKIDEMDVFTLGNSLILVANIGLKGLTLTEDAEFQVATSENGVGEVLEVVDYYVTSLFSRKPNVSSAFEESVKMQALFRMLKNAQKDPSLMKIVNTEKFQSRLNPELKSFLGSFPVVQLQKLLEKGEITDEFLEVFLNYYNITSSDKLDVNLISRVVSLIKNNLESRIGLEIVSDSSISQAIHKCINRLVVEEGEDILGFIRVKLALIDGLDPCHWNEESLLALVRVLGDLSVGDIPGVLLREIGEIAPLVEKVPFWRIEDSDQLARIMEVAYEVKNLQFVYRCLMESRVIQVGKLSQRFCEFVQHLITFELEFPPFPLVGYVLISDNRIKSTQSLFNKTVFYLNNPQEFQKLSRNEKLLIVKALPRSVDMVLQNPRLDENYRSELRDLQTAQQDCEVRSLFGVPLRFSLRLVNLVDEREQRQLMLQEREAAIEELSLHREEPVHIPLPNSQSAPRVNFAEDTLRQATDTQQMQPLIAAPTTQAAVPQQMVLSPQQSTGRRESANQQETVLPYVSCLDSQQRVQPPVVPAPQMQVKLPVGQQSLRGSSRPLANTGSVTGRDESLTD